MPSRNPASCRGSTGWSDRALTLSPLGLFALGAAVRSLRFSGGFVTPYHWDETSPAVLSLQVLRGAFPVHFLDVEYMGATPAYPLAAWFALAGTSTLALDLFAYAVGLAVLWTGYRLARRLLTPPAALLTLAVLGVPPLLLAQRSLDGSLAYPLLLVVGHLLLLGTHSLFFRGAEPRRTLLVLGLLGGVGWWLNPLIVVYLAPFGLLALRTRSLSARAFAWFLTGVLLGGLPAWLYEVAHFPSTRFAIHLAGSAGAEPLAVRAAGIMTRVIPFVAGVSPASLRLSADSLGSMVVLLLGAGAVIRAVIRDRADLAFAIGFNCPATGQGLLLWGVVVTNLALVIFTARGGLNHYLLPLYTVLPCWLGEMFWWWWQKRRLTSATGLAALLVFHLWTNWVDTFGSTPPAERRWVPVRASIEPLVRWLDSQGIRRVYWALDVIRSYEFTYLTGGRIVAADLWLEAAPAHAHLVDAALAPPIVVLHGSENAAPLMQSLAGIGMGIRSKGVGSFVLIEAVPEFGRGFRPLVSDGWAVQASENGEAAGNLIDRDAWTGWHSGGSQAPGQWVAVDLGREELVARVDLLAIDWQDVPAAFRVEVSLDAERWHEVVSVSEYWGPLFFSEHHPFLKVRRGRVQAIFAPVRARFVRLVQTGVVGHRGWAAREVFVYGPGGAPPRAPGPGEIAAALRAQGVRFVYANHWLSAWVRTDSGGTVGTQESNLNLNSYGRTDPRPEWLTEFRPEPGRAILVGSDGDMDGILNMLEGQPLVLRESAAGPYRLLRFSGRGAPGHRVRREGWVATASHEPRRARLAVDGDGKTRWRVGPPVDLQMSFTVDLGVTRTLRRVRVRPGYPASGVHGVRLEHSIDGAAWDPVEPVRWAGPLYWSGSELLRNGRSEWTVAFAPVEARFLRLRPVVAAGHAPWVIGEVDVWTSRSGA